MASTWVPYRDGRWTWIAPWGWTWVDNAPWGYAPFHYGRWVHVHNRWAWAPGRIERHPVWAPALVGWVGGAGWNLNFHSRPSIGQGWYPLSPHDHFVPNYRHSNEHLRRLNAHRRDRQDDKRHDGKHHDYRQRGLTVVPQERFGQRGEVVVAREPRVTPPAAWNSAPAALPPTPRLMREAVARAQEARRDANDRRDGRWEGRRDGSDGDRRDGRWAGQGDKRPAPVITTAPPAVAAPVPQVGSVQPGFVRQPGTITTLPPSGLQRDPRRDGGVSREAIEERQRRFQERQRDEGHRGGAAGAMEAAAARAQAQMPRPQATAVAPPPPRAMPSPPPAAAPVTVSRPAPEPVPQTMRRGDDGPRHRDVRQMER
ncbi:DUF6600 domain-containing protein [Massilia sp. SYSU DXS3249]